ncbi:TNFAIP3-interacting protein 3 [Calypte anna]|uniref:TNFAIP3-interacting protein 3 n=1 Tax=Calypte anna TaxID=9244 RepID=UPI0011C3BACF|nr:TNFAIP3-interacting protein 3 [Calypte anna]
MLIGCRPVHKRRRLRAVPPSRSLSPDERGGVGAAFFSGSCLCFFPRFCPRTGAGPVLAVSPRASTERRRGAEASEGGSHAVPEYHLGAVRAATAGQQRDVGTVPSFLRAAAAGLYPGAAGAHQGVLHSYLRDYFRPGALRQLPSALRGDPQHSHEDSHQHLHLFPGAQRPPHRLLLRPLHHAAEHLLQVARWYESKELDVELRNPIEKHNTYQLYEDRKPIAQESPSPQRTLCSLEKETKVLSEALPEMEEENKLLKEKNASVIRMKEHYECEIACLNKALLNVLEKQHSPVLGTTSEEGDRNSLEDMRTQLEVPRQQMKDFLVQSERPSYPPPLYLSPRINYGNCGLVLHYQDPQAHGTSGRAHEQQHHSPDYQWYVPDQFPPDVQHKANGAVICLN